MTFDLLWLLSFSETLKVNGLPPFQKSYVLPFATFK